MRTQVRSETNRVATLVPARASRGGDKRREFSEEMRKDVRPRLARPVHLTARGRFVSREAASNRAHNIRAALRNQSSSRLPSLSAMPMLPSTVSFPCMKAMVGFIRVTVEALVNGVHRADTRLISKVLDERIKVAQRGGPAVE